MDSFSKYIAMYWEDVFLHNMQLSNIKTGALSYSLFPKYYYTIQHENVNDHGIGKFLGI